MKNYGENDKLIGYSVLIALILIFIVSPLAFIFANI